MYYPNEEDFKLIFQRKLDLRVKIEVLNSDGTIYTELKGLIENGSMSISASSATRRTFQMTITPVKGQEYIDVAEDSPIWIDKKIKLYVGIKNQRDGQYKYYNQGVYLYQSTSGSFDATTNTLQISCSDLNTSLDGTINGSLYGASTTIIPAYSQDESGYGIYYWVKWENGQRVYHDDGSVIFVNHEHGTEEITDKSQLVVCNKYYIALQSDPNTCYSGPYEDWNSAYNEYEYYVTQGLKVKLDHYGCLYYYKIKDMLTEYIEDVATGIEDYSICDIGEGVHGDEEYRLAHPDWNNMPYNIELSAGSNISEAFSQITQLYTGYDAAFDENGVFIVQETPTCEDDDIIVTDNQIRKIFISESSSTDMTTIRNISEVWGEAIETDFYTTDVTYDSTNNVLNCNVDSYLDNATPDDSSNPRTGYMNYDKVAIKMPGYAASYKSGICININDLGNIPIYIDSPDEILPIGSLENNQTYVFKYRSTYISDTKTYDYRFYLMGQYEVHAVNVLTDGTTGDTYTFNDGYSAAKWSKEYFMHKYNIDDENAISLTISQNSPYTIQKIDERVFVETDSGDETVSEALSEAEYLNRKNYRLTDNITLTTTLIPWLTEYTKISYRKANSDEVKEYITQDISHDYSSGQTTITAYTFYAEDYGG